MLSGIKSYRENYDDFDIDLRDCKFLGEGHNGCVYLMPDGRVIKIFKEKGVDFKEWYMLMGQYDTIVFAEAPNDEVMASAAMELSSLGNVHSETMRAFSMDETRKLLGG
jgi:hypothetical protein